MAPFNPVAPDAVVAAEPDEVTVPDVDKGEEEDDAGDSGGSAKRSSIDTTNRSKPLPVFVTNEPIAEASRARPKVNNTSNIAIFILKCVAIERNVKDKYNFISEQFTRSVLLIKTTTT